MSIFDEQISRKPDLYPFTQLYIDAIHSSFWTHKEFNFASDVQDFHVKLNEQEKSVIIKSLSTIGQLEISVKKFWTKLGDNLPHPSIMDMGVVMGANEVVHGNAYERLLEVLGIETAFDDLLKLDIIKGRVAYLKKYLHKFHPDNKKQFIYSLILFTLFVENIALFSQFYIVSWFGRYKNLLKDTNKQIEYSSREEALHFDIGAKLINTIREEHPELFDKELEIRILSESQEAVEYECKIIDWIINGYEYDGLSSKILKEFIKNRLNDSLIKINYSPIFVIDKDILKSTKWFDEQILGNNKTDFFHSRPVEYAKKNQSFDPEDLF